MSNIPRLCFDGERLYVGLMMKNMISKIFWYISILPKSRIGRTCYNFGIPNSKLILVLH